MTNPLATYEVAAFNTATASQNKIHDDAVAGALGFRGGLVPGVDVYAYLTHPVVEQWGKAWLERGGMSVRFAQPVYDGETVIVAMRSGERSGTVEVEATNASGETCATGRAWLSDRVPPPPDLSDHPARPLPEEAPPASHDALPAGLVLGALESGFHADRAGDYLDDVRETAAVYRDESIAHPGFLLRNANYVLAANVRLGPWIHVGSEVQNFATVPDGTRISTHARVVRTYERKGHQFVELDVLMVGNEREPLVHVVHTAIFEPRHATV